MRMTALAGLALALSACGGGDSGTADEANNMATDNLMMDENLMMDSNASMNATGGMDANASTNASAEANLMEKDATTHDADTNLANGL